MHHDPTFWVLARASGLTAYALLTLSVLAGLVLRSRPTGRVRVSDVTELHKTLALTGLAAVGVHAGSLVLDSTVTVTVPALLVPGLVTYRPTAVAAGVVAAWLLLAVTSSFWLRRRIGFKTWRRLHWLTYALFAAASFHGLASGTDSGRPLIEALYLGGVGAVGAATAWRVLVPHRNPIPKGEAA